MGTALRTDHYELTMLTASLRDGTAHRRAAFEVFARTLPAGRRYGVFAGLGRLLDAIDDFRFGPDDLAFLVGTGVVDAATADWLAGYRFAGDIVAYREGELYFPYSPVLTVDATFADAVLLETIVLSILNHDSAIASAAARMVDAAGGRPILEGGSRRTDDSAAVAAARATHLVGFAATSNLEAGRRYGVPTRGTAAHAFTLVHANEADAFASQLDALGVDTTLLVDTYDIPTGIATGVRLANERGAAGPGAVRIDAGDLGHEARRARAQLDGLGATATRIVVSGDLDEYSIEDLVEAGAPVDSFLVGTRAVTGSGHPTANFVYKLVAVAAGPDPAAPLRAVEKRSAAKGSVGGRKQAWRVLDGDGFAVEEHVVAPSAATGCSRAGAGPAPGDRVLQHTVVRAGTRLGAPSNADILAHHRAALAELRPEHRMTVAGPPALTATTAT
jgi:nicotinate phosphoribosyltransferase